MSDRYRQYYELNANGRERTSPLEIFINLFKDYISTIPYLFHSYDEETADWIIQQYHQHWNWITFICCVKVGTQDNYSTLLWSLFLLNPMECYVDKVEEPFSIGTLKRRIEFAGGEV